MISFIQTFHQKFVWRSVPLIESVSVGKVKPDLNLVIAIISVNKTYALRAVLFTTVEVERVCLSQYGFVLEQGEYS
jgi:hypothetical protein